MTPLHIAVRFGCLEATESLVKSDFTNVNAQDVNGDTPAHHAAYHNQTECLYVLANCNNFEELRMNNKLQTFHFHLYEPQTVMFNAKFGRVSQFKKSIQQAKQSIIRCERDFEYVLHVACTSEIQAYEKADHLINECDNRLTCVTDEQKEIPLHVAARHKDTNLIRLLLDKPECQVRVNKPNSDGQTPLHVAVISAKYGNVQALLQQQFCDVNAQDVDGNTPAHCAAVCEYIEILACW